jgi:hypothetical protein
LTYGLPIATLNVKDFEDFGEHQGLNLTIGQRRFMVVSPSDHKNVMVGATITNAAAQPSPRQSQPHRQQNVERGRRAPGDARLPRRQRRPA